MIFAAGSGLALAWSAFTVWAGSLNNNQGAYFDTLTGEWDRWYVALQCLWPLGVWTLIFAFFGGFRRSPRT